MPVSPCMVRRRLMTSACLALDLTPMQVLVIWELLVLLVSKVPLIRQLTLESILKLVVIIVLVTASRSMLTISSKIVDILALVVGTDSNLDRVDI